MIVFCLVPIYTPQDIDAPAIRPRKLFGMKVFWLLMLLMVCAGASEQAMSQWASAFAESALGVSKTVGDLVGPCTFALFMGLARAFFAKMGDRLPLNGYMTFCCVLCIGSYLLAATGIPAVGMLGCGLCGFSVGVLWPGSFSTAATATARRRDDRCMRCWPWPVTSDAAPDRRWSVRSPAHSGKTCARR